MIEEWTRQARAALEELIAVAKFPRASLLVIGASSSEIVGGTIGKDSSDEVGAALVEILLAVAKEHGVSLAFQCCEHLNRALVVERVDADRFGLEEVSVVPWLHAGGAFATNAYRLMENAVVVERIAAAGGLDIGQTMIGMHLKRVAVPVRLQNNKIGSALVTAARTRPPLIGGNRARYE